VWVFIRSIPQDGDCSGESRVVNATGVEGKAMNERGRGKNFAQKEELLHTIS